MRHSPACASSFAVLALVGGLAFAATRARPDGSAPAAAARHAAGAAPRLRRRARAGSGAAPAHAAAPRPRRPRRRASAAARRRRRDGRRPPSGPSATAASTSRTRSPAAPACSTRSTPQTGAPGQFRLGFVTEWFTAGFLCTRAVPLPEPQRRRRAHERHDEPHRGDAVARRVALQARRGHVRGVRRRPAPTRTATRRTSPSLLQVLGDTEPRPQVRGARRATSSTSALHRAAGSSTARARSASTAAARAPSSAARHARPARQLDVVARPAALQPQRATRSTTRATSSQRPRAARGEPVDAHRALRPRRQPRRPLRLPSRRRAFVADERVRPFVEEHDPRPDQPPGLRSATTDEPEPATTASRTTRSLPRRSPSAAASSPGSAGSRCSRRSTSDSAARTNFIEELRPSRRGRSTSAPAGRSTRRTGRRS